MVCQLIWAEAVVYVGQSGPACCVGVALVTNCTFVLEYVALQGLRHDMPACFHDVPSMRSFAWQKNTVLMYNFVHGAISMVRAASSSDELDPQSQSGWSRSDTSRCFFISSFSSFSVVLKVREERQRDKGSTSQLKGLLFGRGADTTCASVRCTASQDFRFFMQY